MALAKADLHAHTWFSDGQDSPEVLVARAKAAGLDLLAVTDHDTLSGIDETVEKGRAAGLEIVPGIEFSAHFKNVEVHIVGLGVAHHDAVFRRVVAEYTAAREERARKMVERLKTLQVRISFDRVKAIAGPGVVGRPHVAQALFETGAVASFNEAFKRYIGRQGPAYVPKLALAPERAIQVIHRAGGVAVLAHGLAGGVGRDHVIAVAEMGLDAVEVVHPKFTEADQAWLRDFAEQKGLALSGGSDWHGEGWSEGEIGKFTVGAEAVKSLRARREMIYNAIQVGS